MKAIRILRDIDPDGLIKKGDVFIQNGGSEFYRSNRQPSQTFSTDYVNMHMNGTKLDYVTSRGQHVNRHPHGWPNLMEEVR